MTPDDPLTDTEPTTPVPVTTEAPTDRTVTTATSMVEPGVTTTSVTNTELSSTNADATTEMIMATVGVSIPLVGGAVGGGSVVVIAITAIFVGVVVLIVTKHCSRQKQNENSTLSEG